ncbi:Pex19 protein [Fimicolochytrium jonesii]|uniref:Pex19 protein n=1 Tax=Fimicolochytrium jonesii TaxID=1396493 RepID=UPI0022FEC003|nr:Pex19 protein [Fimicolochytrium jonesii]KAI8823975.1 Pex19 protein [Fimicolochytrium jonesii]
MTTKQPEVADDDLDSYLDDVLDDFSAPVAPPSSTQTTGTGSIPAADPTLDSDFTRQLALNMEELFKESLAGDDTGADTEGINAAMTQLLDTFKELQAPGGGPSPLDALLASAAAAGSEPPTAASARQAPAKASSQAPAAAAAAASQTKTIIPPSASSTTTTTTTTTSNPNPKSFHDAVSQTMNKLRTSSDKVEAEVAESAKLAALTGGLVGDDAAMEQMMKELEGLMSSGDFDNVFGGLMDQLMSKELLHEPMRDLAARYPPWLSANESTLSTAEIEKYKQQHAYVLEIVKIYDASTSTEGTPDEQKRVAELMQKMQESGSPPNEILQELAPGLELGPDGTPKLGGLGGLGGVPGQECSIM